MPIITKGQPFLEQWFPLRWRGSPAARAAGNHTLGHQPALQNFPAPPPELEALHLDDLRNALEKK